MKKLILLALLPACFSQAESSAGSHLTTTKSTFTGSTAGDLTESDDGGSSGETGGPGSASGSGEETTTKTTTKTTSSEAVTDTTTSDTPTTNAPTTTWTETVTTSTDTIETTSSDTTEENEGPFYGPCSPMGTCETEEECQIISSTSTCGMLCDTKLDCPTAPEGQSPICEPVPSGGKACFLACIAEPDSCPTGSRCIRLSTSYAYICLWDRP